MDQSGYLFSVIAAIIGMIVVFLFLSFLSLLMHSLGRLFKVAAKPDSRQPDERSAGAGNKSASTAPAGSAHGAGHLLPQWAVAVAAAYLLDESEAVDTSAASWHPLASDVGRPHW